MLSVCRSSEWYCWGVRGIVCCGQLGACASVSRLVFLHECKGVYLARTLHSNMCWVLGVFKCMIQPANFPGRVSSVFALYSTSWRVQAQPLLGAVSDTSGRTAVVCCSECSCAVRIQLCILANCHGVQESLHWNRIMIPCGHIATIIWPDNIVSSWTGHAVCWPSSMHSVYLTCIRAQICCDSLLGAAL